MAARHLDFVARTLRESEVESDGDVLRRGRIDAGAVLRLDDAFEFVPEEDYCPFGEVPNEAVPGVLVDGERAMIVGEACLVGERALLCFLLRRAAS